MPNVEINHPQDQAEFDHRKLGEKLDLWTFSEYVGSGLPLFTERGNLVRELILDQVRELQKEQGIYEVHTPQIAKAVLFETSGHLERYQDSMFQVISNYSNEKFYLKPMNCPQHTQIFTSRPRTYKDLPIRLADTAMLYRDEKPGELLGLSRTRAFSQDDCHVFCRGDQVISEMNLALDMTKTIMDTYGFKYKYRLSTRDLNNKAKYIGDPDKWEEAEKISEQVLVDRGIEYFPGPGEAAFYAPKLDLIATDSLNRPWQLSTLQVDFVLPERFQLSYINKDGTSSRPAMLHRAICGSPERLMSILLEHFGGNLPTWLAPDQVAIVPVLENNISYAEQLSVLFKKYGIRTVKYFDTQDRIGKRVREAKGMKVPYTLVVGNQEEVDQSVAINARPGGSIETRPFNLNIGNFIVKLNEEINNKSINLTIGPDSI